MPIPLRDREMVLRMVSALPWSTPRLPVIGLIGARARSRIAGRDDDVSVRPDLHRSQVGMSSLAQMTELCLPCWKQRPHRHVAELGPTPVD